ncbi:hypothetical protein H6A24_08855 [Bacteroides caecicola]|uniref:Uncharacterized protein n=1 Tax=Bacteroides caecicola TaxID=1462569 RepID=A0ABS2F8M4_9BACE|nr:hypothetical protein [Bacteroides caecicola]MBM6806602.1 hypothetical protein [Bacteroides caecicola]
MACIFKEQLKETVKQLKPVVLHVVLVLVILASMYIVDASVRNQLNT